MPQAGEPASHVPPRDLARLALLGALVGLPAGLVAFAFIGLVHELESWLWDDLPVLLGADAPPWYLVLALPVLGGLLVHLARMLPGDGGASPIHGLHLGGAPRPRDAWGVALAAVATLPFGMVLGPEAPLIALGAIVGTWVTSWARMTDQGRTVVATAGSGAAMSTLFGGPLVAGLMLLEGGVGAGALVIPLLVPALVSAAVAYTLVTGLGSWAGLPVGGLAMPGLPEYETVLVRDVVVAVLVGVLAAVVARLVRRAATSLAGLEPRLGRGPLLLLGGLAVGVLALVADALGADPQEVLFSGQSSIPDLVASGSVAAVLVVLVAKVLAYAVSLGAGFRGGPIFPAIFMGVAFASFAVVTVDLSPTVAIAVGAGAGMAAMTRMVVSPVLFAALLVGRPGLDAVPVAVIATVAAWLGSAVLDHRDLLGRRRADADEAATAAAPAGTALPVPAPSVPAPGALQPGVSEPGVPEPGVPEPGVPRPAAAAGAELTPDPPAAGEGP